LWDSLGQERGRNNLCVRVGCQANWTPHQTALSPKPCKFASTNSNAGHIFGMLPSHRRVMSEISDTSGRQQKVNDYAMDLDGAFDPPLSPTKPPVNLNKPLPLSPGDKFHHRSVSSHTRPPSFSISLDTANYPSTATNVFPPLSQNSTRRDFRDVARDLLNAEDMSHLPELSPVRKVEKVESDEISPSKSPRRQHSWVGSCKANSPQYLTSSSPVSYTSFENANPFRQDPILLTSTAPAPLSFRKATDTENGFEAPQSRSEFNLRQLRLTPKSVPVVDYDIPPHLPHYPSRLRPQQPNHDVNVHARGRPTQRSDSPVQQLERVSEDETLDMKKSQKKRSRSRVKTFFGFGKSTNLKDIAGQPQAKEAQSDQIKHDGGKSWGDRLRHGFLVRDILSIHMLWLTLSDIWCWWRGPGRHSITFRAVHIPRLTQSTLPS